MLLLFHHFSLPLPYFINTCMRQIITECKLSEEGFNAVQNYIQVAHGVEIKKKASKRNITTKVRTAINRDRDQTYITREFHVPPGMLLARL